MRKIHVFTLIASAAALSLSACESAKIEKKYPSSVKRELGGGQDIYTDTPGIFGSEGLFSAGKKSNNDNANSAFSINSFLWRATLDTLSFMPLASADPFGGTIITDWHMPDGKTSERFKVNAFINGRELKANGVKVTVFRQTKSGGDWVGAATDSDTATKLEDSILTRARQLHIKKLSEDK